MRDFWISAFDVWIQWNDFFWIKAALNRLREANCSSNPETIPKQWWWTLLKDRVPKVPSCHAVSFFCSKLFAIWKLLEKRRFSCSELFRGSHPGWFHLAWGSNDGKFISVSAAQRKRVFFSALARHQPRNPWKCQQLALYHHQRHQQLYINNEREQLSNRTIFQAVTNIDQPFVLGLSSQLQ